MRLKDKVVVITGAAGGIGKATAQAVVREGAHVVIIDINGEALAEAEKSMKSSGGRVLSIIADVTDKSQVEDMVGKTVSMFGKLDVLVNNAGGSLFTPSPIDAIREEDWDKVLDLNLKATFFCCQAAVKQMKKQGSGKIINTSSSLAARGLADLVGCNYSAAKAGIMGLTRHLARELGKFGITVNTLCPGATISERIEKMLASKTEEEKAQMIKSTPLGRHAKPDDIADVTVFLCSDESRYITGTIIDVNGGRYMM
jgi:3-oxoacyl-[acyl-carrier protein] reductase